MGILWHKSEWGEAVVRSFLIKPALDTEYPMIEYGKGCYLYDSDGNKYLDGASGAVTANIGHGVKEIIEAMYDQASKVSFVYRSQFTNQAAEALAEKMAMKTKGSLNWSFFVNSGSEATETAIKIAIQYWQEKGFLAKTKILSRWISYHGITLGALSMSGHPERRILFTPLLQDFPAINPPYCYRCPYKSKAPECGFPCAYELDTVIRRTGPENIAAFIAEPIVGAAGGAITPPDGYYGIIKDICEHHEILFIADEVMTGFGRTGTMLALEHWGIEPDIVAFGKGMGAGYTPIAATLVSDSIIEPILQGSKVIMSGHTLSANPQSCAVSLAVFDYLEKNRLFEKVDNKSKHLLHALKKLKLEYPQIGDIRGKGLLLGLEFVENVSTKESFPPHLQITKRIIAAAQKNGLILYPAGAGIDGKTGDAVLIAPPLTITTSEIDLLLLLLRKSLQDVFQGIKS